MRVPRIRENCHRPQKSEKIGSLQIQTGFLTFSLGKCAPKRVHFLYSRNKLTLLRLYKRHKNVVYFIVLKNKSFIKTSVDFCYFA